MATRALQQVITYIAWNTSTNAYVTGDVANHSTSWEKDGTRSATTNSPAEVDATNLPGLYKVTMTATETDCIEGVLGGKSTTASVVLIPTMVSFSYLNTSAPATAGVPDVNVKNINNVAATSVTTINANVGTTQPVNFTGTAGSALVKSDVTDIAGSAVSTSSAQLGVNVVNIAGQAAALDANNLLKVDVEDINGNATAAQNVSKANQAIGRGTCTTGGSTTSVTTSAWTPGGASIVSGQFIGRTIVFDANTTTGALQGQATNIIANTAGATPTFTVGTLTTAPSSGDTFGVY